MNRKILEKYYDELDNIVKQGQTSAHIRSTIQDFMDMRKVRYRYLDYILNIFLIIRRIGFLIELK